MFHLTPKQMEKILKNDGWYLSEVCGSHRQYEHATKAGKATIPWHGDLKKTTMFSIFKQAQIDKRSVFPELNK